MQKGTRCNLKIKDLNTLTLKLKLKRTQENTTKTPHQTSNVKEIINSCSAVQDTNYGLRIYLIKASYKSGSQLGKICSVLRVCSRYVQHKNLKLFSPLSSRNVFYKPTALDFLKAMHGQIGIQYKD